MTSTAAPTTVASTSAPAGDAPAWHAMTPAEVFEAQGVTQDAGLTDAEVASRRAKVGPNKFAEAAKTPRWQAFLAQYRDPMQLVLLGAGVVSMFLPGQFATGV